MQTKVGFRCVMNYRREGSSTVLPGDGFNDRAQACSGEGDSRAAVGGSILGEPLET